MTLSTGLVSKRRRLATTEPAWSSPSPSESEAWSQADPLRSNVCMLAGSISKGRPFPLDPAKHADRLQVAIPRQTELAAGDPILIRRNARKHGLINGEVLTCTAVQSDGSILTREGKTLPASFRDFAHGYVVTSHKSQGRTHDQVVIAAAQMDAQGGLRRLLPWPSPGLHLYSRQSPTVRDEPNNPVTGWRLPMSWTQPHCVLLSGAGRSSGPGSRPWSKRSVLAEDFSSGQSL